MGVPGGRCVTGPPGTGRYGIGGTPGGGPVGGRPWGTSAAGADGDGGGGPSGLSGGTLTPGGLGCGALTPGGATDPDAGVDGTLKRQSCPPSSEMPRLTGSRMGGGAGLRPAVPMAPAAPVVKAGPIVRALSTGRSSSAVNASKTPALFWVSRGSRAASSATLERSTLTPTRGLSLTCPYWSSSRVGLAGRGVRHL